MKRLAQLSPLLAVALAPATAQACVSPPPPPMNPGESQAAYDQRVTEWRAETVRFENDEFDQRLRGYWDAAAKVVLVRVDRVTPLNEGGYRLRLTGMKWLKGAKAAHTFTITSPPPVPCGPIDLAAKGDTVVLYIPAAPSDQRPFWIRPKEIRDPRVTAGLPAETK